MKCHLIEGEAGCVFARDNDCVAVVVDALRASATAAMLFEHGATEIHAVREVEEARAVKETMPDALLYGERHAVPPEGFDYGNSPLEAAAAKGKTVILTTTTGTARLVEAWGAKEIFMGTTVNAMAAASVAVAAGVDVVVIPAGLAGNPDFDGAEDWAAAVTVATFIDAPVGEGALMYRDWSQRLEWDGLPKTFREAPHGKNLLAKGFQDDVAFCARLNVTQAVPKVVGYNGREVHLINGAIGRG